MVPLIGYTDRTSVRPGEKVEVKVSCASPDPYIANLVEILSADPNPDGAGVRYREIKANGNGTYPSRLQAIARGSYGIVEFPGSAALGSSWTFSIRVQPWILEQDRQAIASFGGRAGFDIVASEKSTTLELASGQEIDLPPMLRKKWYEIRVAYDGNELSFHQIPVEPRDGAGVSQAEHRTGLLDRGISQVVFGAACDQPSGRFTRFFNGRLEDPAILGASVITPGPLDLELSIPTDVVHWWDFSVDISGDTIADRGSKACHGRLINLPARAVCGSRWSGKEVHWVHALREYAAVHFHQDDLYDCGWETDFSITIPDDLKSGVYGIRLRSGRTEDVIPLFVLPARTARKSRVALLIPTFTYQLYANFDRANFDEDYRERRADWGAYPHHPAEHREYGLSTYDRHRDGSGVIYSSSRRPVLTDRPGYIAYVDLKGSGVRHLSADMHIVDWLHATGIEFDIVTDHDLDREGLGLIEEYACLLTGTHPEYHTLESLNALQSYVDGGGKLVYLGGNGFYWKIGRSSRLPDVLEVRRAEAGTRAWATEPGEYYHALDGAYGGLWRRNRRPPQLLAGVGMTAQGRFEGTYYRRLASSYAPELAWMFDGISDEIIGDFGLSGGGAAGFELDRADFELGTPANAIVVARSEGHQSHFGVTPEEVLSTLPHIGGGGTADLIRADMTYFENQSGGAVFSVGSITFCGSLSHDSYDNNVSRLLKNVVSRFAGLAVGPR